MSSFEHVSPTAKADIPPTPPDFRLLFEAVPDPCLVLDTDFRVVAVNQAYLAATMTIREEILGRSILDVFPANPDDVKNENGARELVTSLNRVLKNRRLDIMPVLKYDIRQPQHRGGRFEERFWSPVNSPILSADGEVIYIINRVDDVTEFAELSRADGGEMGRRRREKVGWYFKRGGAMVGGGFLIAIFLLVLMGGLIFQRLNDAQAASRWVNHSYQVIITSRDLFVALLDAETGQRGFVITGDEKYLQPYNDAEGRINRDYDELEKLTVDNAEQQSRLKRLKPLIAQRTAIIRDVIEARRTKGYETARAIIVKRHGKSLMDAIRVQDADIASAELMLLRDRTSQETRYNARLSGSLLTGALLAVVLLCSVFFIHMRELFLRRAIEDELEKDQKQLYALLGQRTRLTEELVEQREKLEEVNVRLEVEVSERMAAQQALSQVNTDLERSNKELELFASITSHDLQEPLHTITSFTELLAHEYRGKLGPEADKYMHFITDASGYMHEMINDLLAYSRLGTRAKPFSNVQLEAISHRALENLGESIAESKAVIEKEPLPEVEGDDVQLTQLFQNLIGNAIKFRKKDLPLELGISCKRSGDEWVIGVHDNGIGIEERHFDRIFTIFRRLHTREEYMGSGIGLAICRKIVEHHGGRIWVESTLGQGSSFYFTVPVEGGVT